MIVGTGLLAAVFVLSLAGGVTEKLEVALAENSAGGNGRAGKLLKEGIGLKESGELEQAERVLRRVIREYPNANYEDVNSKRRYSEDAREYLAVIACLKKRGSDRSAKSPEELIAAIKTAYFSGQTQVLTQLASCDFVVGLAESDDVWAMSPEEAIPAIVTLLTMEDWESAFLDATESGRGDFVFQLGDVSGKWTWKGLVTSNQKVFESLWKIHKQRHGR